MFPDLPTFEIPSLSQIGDSIRDGVGGVTEQVTNPFDWVKDLFSLNTGVRVVSVIVGISFIIIAVIVLVGSTDAGKSAIKAATIVA